jgi:hypothetical protein
MISSSLKAIGLRLPVLPLPRWRIGSPAARTMTSTVVPLHPAAMPIVSASLVQHPFCKFSAYGFAPMGRL